MIKSFFSILLAVVATSAITPYTDPVGPTVQFNRTNLNAAPNGINQIFNTLGGTNAELETSLQLNFGSPNTIPFINSSKRVSSSYYYVNTVSDLASLTSTLTNAYVIDPIRGGYFYWSTNGTTNGGTIFAGSGGKWHRANIDGAINVKWYGAVGDGTTDDSSSLTNLAFSTRTNALVYFPPGDYRFGQTLQWYGGVRLMGAQRFSSVLRWNGGATTNYMMKVGYDASYDYAHMGYSIENLKLDGNAQASGLIVTNQLRGKHNNIWFYNISGTAARFNVAYYVALNECLFSSITGYGVIQSGASANKYDHVDFDGITTAVYYELPGNGDVFIGTSFQNCSNAFEMPKALGQAGVSFLGCYWEAVTNHFKIGETGAGGSVGPVLISGGNFAYTGSSALRFDGAIRSLTFSDNTVGPGMFVSTNVEAFHLGPNYFECCGATLTNNAQATYSTRYASQPVMPNILVTNIASIYQLNLGNGYVTNALGIGTAYPQSPLHVIGTNSVVATIERTILGTNYGMQLGSDDAGPVISAVRGNRIQFYSSNILQMIVSPTNVTFSTNIYINSAMITTNQGLYLDSDRKLSSYPITYGTVNGVANAGTGTGIYASGTTNIVFNSIAGANGITLSSNANTITLGYLPTNHTTIALGDYSTVISTGLKAYWRAPYALNIIAVRGSLLTTSSSGDPVFNIKKNGTTIFSTKLTIDAGETTSTTALVPYVLSTTTAANDDEFRFEIDTAGTGAVGPQIKIYYTAQ
jgi:hypothetical protein